METQAQRARLAAREPRASRETPTPQELMEPREQRETLEHQAARDPLDHRERTERRGAREHREAQETWETKDRLAEQERLDPKEPRALQVFNCRREPPEHLDRQETRVKLVTWECLEQTAWLVVLAIRELLVTME